MHARAFGAGAALVVLSCGTGLPDFDSPSGGAGGAAAEGAERSDAAAGPRVLTDVSPPRETDGRSSQGTGGSPREPSVPGSDATSRDAIADRRDDRDQRDADASARDLDARAREGDTLRAVDAPVSHEGPLVERDGDATQSFRDTLFETGLDVSADSSGDHPPESGTYATPDAPDTGAHLLISEVVTRPGGAEMIEVMNPTNAAIILSDYLLSDSHLYYKIASNAFTTASGSDFAARFPDGAVIWPGQYVVVALANASGGSASFEGAYGQKPDFELRPTANGASDDASIPNMLPAQIGSSVGATASLTDGGEPVVLFFYREGALVSDVDYVFVGAPSASNPAVDKTGVAVGERTYAPDTPGAFQHLAPAPLEGGSLHRCTYVEPDEKNQGGNGLTGHDETAENVNLSFVSSTTVNQRTPGGPPPPSLCAP